MWGFHLLSKQVCMAADGHNLGIHVDTLAAAPDMRIPPWSPRAGRVDPPLPPPAGLHQPVVSIVPWSPQTQALRLPLSQDCRCNTLCASPPLPSPLSPPPTQVYHLMCRRGIEATLATFGTLICIASEVCVGGGGVGGGLICKTSEVWGRGRGEGVCVCGGGGAAHQVTSGPFACTLRGPLHTTHQ